jgi:hypothetical protein
MDENVHPLAARFLLYKSIILRKAKSQIGMHPANEKRKVNLLLKAANMCFT